MSITRNHSYRKFIKGSESSILYYRFVADHKMQINSSNYQSFRIYTTTIPQIFKFGNSKIHVDNSGDPDINSYMDISQGIWNDFCPSGCTLINSNTGFSKTVFNTIDSGSWNFDISDTPEMDQNNLTIGNTYWFSVWFPQNDISNILMTDSPFFPNTTVKRLNVNGTTFDTLYTDATYEFINIVD